MFKSPGSRTIAIESILENDPRGFPELGKKIILMTTKYIGSMPTVNLDDFKPPRKKNLIYQLWYHVSRKYNVVAGKELQKAFPGFEEKIFVWDRFVDINGKTTLKK
jgi:hypothetical protein